MHFRGHQIAHEYIFRWGVVSFTCWGSLLKLLQSIIQRRCNELIFSFKLENEARLHYLFGYAKPSGGLSSVPLGDEMFESCIECQTLSRYRIGAPVYRTVTCVSCIPHKLNPAAAVVAESESRSVVIACSAMWSNSTRSC